jgi:hypothetical protein
VYPPTLSSLSRRTMLGEEATGMERAMEGTRLPALAERTTAPGPVSRRALDKPRNPHEQTSVLCR